MDQAEAAATAEPLSRSMGRPGNGAAVGGAGETAARRVAAILASALLLVWPAFWNGYPLVFADTGTNLGQALIVYLGWDRPPFYSVFLLATHWRLSLWGPVIAQGLIVAHLLGLVLREVGRPEPRALLLAAAGLAVFTGLPWVTAQLIPDVFTGVVLLSLWLAGFRWARLSTAERWWLLLLTTGGVAVHQSHLPLALGLAGLGGLLLWAWRGLRPALAGVARMAGPALLAVLAMLAVNWAGHGRASVSPFGAVFLAARLIGDGPGLEMLRERCPAGVAWRICGMLDRLGPHHNDFLWNPEGVLRGELGGAKAWAPEATEIVAATLGAAPGKVAARLAANTLRQLTLLDTGDGLEPWPGEPGPEPVIARFLPHELAAYRASRQYRGLLLADAQAIAPLHRAVAWGGLLGLMLVPLLRRDRLGRSGAALVLFVLAAGLGNAAITGGLSGPAVRYQARLAWVFVLVPGALLAMPRRRRGGTRGSKGAPGHECPAPRATP